MWDKLKREWKTAVWGVASVALESYDLILAPFLATNPIVSEKYRWIVSVLIPVGFLVLRKWRDTHKEE